MGNEMTNNTENGKKIIIDASVIISTLLCLIPIIMGVIVWDKLPELIPTKYGLNDEPKQLAPKWVTVFLLPAVFAFFSFIMSATTNAQKKKVGYNQSVFLKSLMPLLSIVSCTTMLLKSLGLPINSATAILPLCSLIFILIGNYMPKTKQNKVVGIKFPWTLKNEEVWAKTQHITGYAWVVLGVISLIFSFTDFKFIVFFICLGLMVFIPLISSLIFNSRR